jgi:hypothetical protein
LNLRACALVVAGYIVFHLFFLLSAAFLSFLRAAGPRLRRVSLCFGLLTTAAISCFGLVKVSKKKNEAQPVTRHAASCADTFCPAPPPVRLGLVVCPVGYIKKEKSKKKESKKKENKKKKREIRTDTPRRAASCAPPFSSGRAFFWLESLLHIIKKRVEEVAIVSVEKPAGYLVALVSLCSFFFLLLVLFLHFVSSNCQYVLALLFNFASLLDCANP